VRYEETTVKLIMMEPNVGWVSPDKEFKLVLKQAPARTMHLLL